MKFVEIIENEKQPRLTGGRRGASTLQSGTNNVNTPLVPVAKLPATAGRRCGGTLLPGTNAVSSNLVPPSKLPPSAGSLASVMASLKPKRGKKSGSGITDKFKVLSDPEHHLEEYVDLVNKSSPASVPTEIIDAQKEWEAKQASGGKRKRGRPKKGGAVPSPEDMAWKRLGGKMSKLVPSHGHGATTQIGTNYKLSQFGGAIQPIGNTASTLSPALSQGSIGAGRKLLPKGKELMKFLKIMVKGRNRLHGDGMLGDAWEKVKALAMRLYKEIGPEVFEIGKDTFLKWLRKEAEEYILGKKDEEEGGAWGISTGNILASLFSVGKSLLSSLAKALGPELIADIQREVLKLGINLAKDKAEQFLGLKEKPDGKVKVGSGMPGSNGHGVRKIGGTIIIDPRTGEQHTIDNTISPYTMPSYKKKINEFFKEHPESPPFAVIKKFVDDMLGKRWSDSVIKDFYEIVVEHYKKNGNGRPGSNGHGVRKIPIGDVFRGGVRLGEDGHGVRKIGGNERKAVRGGVRPGSNGHGVRKPKKPIGGDPSTWTPIDIPVSIGKPVEDGGKFNPIHRIVVTKDGAGKKGKARGAIVAEVMKKHGLSLPMASKFVKEHGLY